jgi:acetyl/propionyl-CoA carboxylase alpha subunit
MFESILIAGRGDVGARVARTCRRVGVTVADAELPADLDRWCPDAESVVGTALKWGVGAIHPGYVAPAARANLARVTREAGLTFVGPSSEALRAIENKLVQRSMAMSLGIRTVPGTDHPIDSVADALADAERLGYPVMVKPLMGTAGIGVRQVDEPEELESAIEASSAEARAKLGSGDLYLEKAFYRPRQLEVTVVSDGEPAPLGERECSLQRHHQVLIAESPSPLLLQMREGEPARTAISESAVRLSEAMELRGIATFEFLCDVDGRFHFMDCNADMHGAILVTEMLTGLDPIELQLQLSAGEKLTHESRLRRSGHAFEVRVLAENPARDFAPSEGVIKSMRFPPVPHGKVRIETIAKTGETVPQEGEPLLARIASHAPIRHQALLNLDRTLAETLVVPVGTNLRFLRQVLNHESFRAGQFDTWFATRLAKAA